VIADNVGDNVGDCAGMAADLFETFAVTVIATMLIGGLVFKGSDAGIIYPLVISACRSVVDRGLLLRQGTGGRQDHECTVPRPHCRCRDLAGAVLASDKLDPRPGGRRRRRHRDDLYLAAVVGLLLTAALVYITEYYTGTQFAPVKYVAQASTTVTRPT